MSDAFLGEIRMVPFNFAPKGWALCNGQLQPISQNTALFSLLGTSYGGDGKSTFALPDLQGRSPRGQGQGPGLTDVVIGESAGAETETLDVTQLPSHTHTVSASGAAGSKRDPRGNTWADGGVNRFGAPANPAAELDPLAISGFGTAGPHDNLPPYLVVNFVIALVGIFPARP